MKSLALFLPILLAACQTSDVGCGGRALGLNPGHWQPTRADLKPCASAAPAGR